jgi:phosphoribosylamine--glycine ligase
VKVLVIGAGAREHALAWKLAQSDRVSRVFVAPGNPGTAADPALKNLPIVDLAALADFAVAEKIGLTVVGPEAPLAAGVVDLFKARGLRIFGPTQAAAQLESSKAFAKAFMQRHRIPTAAHAVFADAAAARAYVTAQGAPIVVKADGLAAGKGVVVAQTVAEAHAAIDDMLGANTLGVAHNTDGARVVIEEFMVGEEASFIVVASSAKGSPQAVALATSQDHKRLGNGDTGPNTGGMGAYSPAPVVTPNVHARAMHEIVLPTLAAMQAEGLPFTGFLYAGLMIDGQGQPRVVEFNARLGDPEAEVILMRLKSDLLDLLVQAADGTLERAAPLQWDRRTALGVVMAAAGYPAAPEKGAAIADLPPDSADLRVFHAGTQRDAEGQLRAQGGRVLCVTALGEPVRVAQQRALAAVRGISFPGAQWRDDIGHRAVKH